MYLAASLVAFALGRGLISVPAERRLDQHDIEEVEMIEERGSERHETQDADMTIATT